MKNKAIIERYASVIYLNYTAENMVADIREYPDYIAEEIGLGFSIPFIKGLFKRGLLEKGEKHFELTEAGKQLLEENADYVKFFNLNSPYVPFVDFYEFANSADAAGKNFYEKAEAIFEAKVKEVRSKKKYLAVESLHMELADIALELGDERKALFHYLVNLCYAVSGIKEYPYIRRFKKKQITRIELMTQYRNCLNVSPYVILGIERLKDFYDDSIVDEVYNSQKLGFTLFSRARFKELVAKIMAGEYNNAFWQARIAELTRKRMGFVPLKNQKAQQKAQDTDTGQSEPVQDDSQIIDADDEANQDEVSDAMKDEIAETESKINKE